MGELRNEHACPLSSLLPARVEGRQEQAAGLTPNVCSVKATRVAAVGLNFLPGASLDSPLVSNIVVCFI